MKATKKPKQTVWEQQIFSNILIYCTNKKDYMYEMSNNIFSNVGVYSIVLLVKKRERQLHEDAIRD